ncbi:MAG: hypothetical protein B7Z02_12440 [Rhodobacterales bacterium 32-67-9]|nr:MAG: hypothetical protein B7Z02_12440 [Rhodobacterales bacterium 32-67-9]
MEDITFKSGRLAVMLGTAAFIVALPFHMTFDKAEGIIAVKASQAFAKSGDDDGDDDHSGSGGGDDDDDDNSGSGSDDDDDDDSSGSGSSDDSDDDDDSSDDSSDDDSSSSSSSGGTSSGSTDGANGGVTVSKIEVSSSGVEVRYSDGTKEEIENGRYERKNAAGRTVEERRATQADLDRILSLN